MTTRASTLAAPGEVIVWAHCWRDQLPEPCHPPRYILCLNPIKMGPRDLGAVLLHLQSFLTASVPTGTLAQTAQLDNPSLQVLAHGGTSSAPSPTTKPQRTWSSFLTIAPRTSLALVLAVPGEHPQSQLPEAGPHLQQKEE